MSFSDDLVARFEPWLTPDLVTYLRAVALCMSEMELYTFDLVDADGNLSEGWTRLYDPFTCPAPALPHLAMYKGERLPIGWSEAAAREQINDAPNMHRGKPKSMFQAAQKHLTGNRLVSMIERADGVTDKVRVITYTSQTPTPAQTLADIQAVTPADVILDYQTLSGQTWRQVRTTYATWRALMNDNATWAKVATGLSGTSDYVRPGPT